MNRKTKNAPPAARLKRRSELRRTVNPSPTLRKLPVAHAEAGSIGPVCCVCGARVETAQAYGEDRSTRAFWCPAHAIAHPQDARLDRFCRIVAAALRRIAGGAE
jgi:hypothetical protein